jgi:aerobic C4-dicarboxylate transport protein
VGRVAGKAFIYFFTFSTLALVIGMIVSHIVQPGKGLNIDPTTLNGAEVEKYVKAAHDNSLVSFIYNIIPETLFSPLTGDNILQVLLVAILFGVALALTSEKSYLVFDFLQALTIPIFKVVEILMKLAPIGALEQWLLRLANMV